MFPESTVALILKFASPKDLLIVDAGEETVITCAIPGVTEIEFDAVLFPTAFTA